MVLNYKRVLTWSGYNFSSIFTNSYKVDQSLFLLIRTSSLTSLANNWTLTSRTFRTESTKWFRLENPHFNPKNCANKGWKCAGKWNAHDSNGYFKFMNQTYCVLSVNAADVMDEGSPKPLMTSCHSFLLITSTRPPRAMTRLNSS